MYRVSELAENYEVGDEKSYNLVGICSKLATSSEANEFTETFSDVYELYPLLGLHRQDADVAPFFWGQGCHLGEVKIGDVFGVSGYFL